MAVFNGQPLFFNFVTLNTVIPLRKITIQHLLVVSFVIRILACLSYYFFFRPSELKPIIDGEYQGLGTDGYFQIARTLWLSGEYAFEVGGTPVHSRPPLHPFLMSLTSAWSEKYWFFLWFIVSSSLGTLSVFFVYKIAQRWNFTHKQSMILAWLIALHPYLVIITRSTTFVHIGTVLLLYVFYVYWQRNESYKKYIFLGFLCGLCLLTHGTFQILPFIFLFFLIRKRKFVYALLIVLFTFLTVLPWSIRNYVTFNKPIFLVTGMGMQYWKGEESAFRHKVDIYQKVYQEHTGKSLEIAYFCTIDPKDDELLWKLGLKNLAENPFQAIQRFLYGIIIFLFPHETGWEKFFFTFVVNLPVYSLIIRNLICNSWLSWQKEILTYFLVVILAFAFFTPHAGYIVMFLPLITLLTIPNKHN